MGNKGKINPVQTGCQKLHCREQIEDVDEEVSFSGLFPQNDCSSSKLPGLDQREPQWRHDL